MTFRDPTALEERQMAITQELNAEIRHLQEQVDFLFRTFFQLVGAVNTDVAREYGRTVMRKILGHADDCQCEKEET